MGCAVGEVCSTGTGLAPLTELAVRSVIFGPAMAVNWVAAWMPGWLAIATAPGCGAAGVGGVLQATKKSALATRANRVCILRVSKEITPFWNLARRQGRLCGLQPDRLARSGSVAPPTAELAAGERCYDRRVRVRCGLDAGNRPGQG